MNAHATNNSNSLYNKAHNTLKQLPIKHNENTHDISNNKDDDDELNCDYIECIPNEIHVVSPGNIDNYNNNINENVNDHNVNINNNNNSNNITQAQVNVQPKPKKKNKKSKSHLFSKLSYPTSNQHSTQLKKHIKFINTNPSSSPTSASPSNKYEQYNTEAIAYKAYNRYSKCKPTSSNFYDRMKFYSIKKQTQSEAIDIIVDRSKRKIKETDRILTFNRSC